MSNFVTASLETHLFFGRIMKEHSLFLQVSFQPPGNGYKNQADWYRRRWEQFLRRVVKVSNGIVDENVLASGEVVTEFTEKAERQTSRLTGIPIDSSITEAEHRCKENMHMVRIVRELNNEALSLIGGMINLKQNILDDVDSCWLTTCFGKQIIILEY